MDSTLQAAMVETASAVNLASAVDEQPTIDFGLAPHEMKIFADNARIVTCEGGDEGGMG